MADRRKPESGKQPETEVATEGHAIADALVARVADHEQTTTLAKKLKLPRCAALLRSVGYSELDIQKWLLSLSRISLGDEQLVRLIQGESLSTIVPSPTKKRFVIWRHQFAHLLHHKKLSHRLLYSLSWAGLLFGAMFKSGLGTWGYLGGAIVLAFKLRGFWKELDPVHLPLLHRTMNERNLRLRSLVYRLQLWFQNAPSQHEIETFRTDVLQLVASYVRDHRSDLQGRKVFVNLLVAGPSDTVTVVSRSDELREVPKTYTPEECSVVWKVLQTGIPQVCGDLQIEHPGPSSSGKKYKSILALPIKLGHQVLGAVSIDSEEAHHFEAHDHALSEELAPYVQLLASAVGIPIAIATSEDHDTDASPKELPPGKES